MSQSGDLCGYCPNVTGFSTDLALAHLWQNQRP